MVVVIGLLIRLHIEIPNKVALLSIIQANIITYIHISYLTLQPNCKNRFIPLPFYFTLGTLYEKTFKGWFQTS